MGQRNTKRASPVVHHLAVILAGPTVASEHGEPDVHDRVLSRSPGRGSGGN